MTTPIPLQEDTLKPILEDIWNSINADSILQALKKIKKHTPSTQADILASTNLFYGLVALGKSPRDAKSRNEEQEETSVIVKTLTQMIRKFSHQDRMRVLSENIIFKILCEHGQEHNARAMMMKPKPVRSQHSRKRQPTRVPTPA